MIRMPFLPWNTHCYAVKRRRRRTLHALFRCCCCCPSRSSPRFGSSHRNVTGICRREEDRTRKRGAAVIRQDSPKSPSSPRNVTRFSRIRRRDWDRTFSHTGAAVVSGSSPGSSSSFHGNFARSPGFRRTQEQSPRILLRCCCRCCWIPLGRLWTATPFRIHSQVSMIPRYSPNLKTGSLKDDSFVGITGRRLQGFGQRTRKIHSNCAY
ncbi:uncharacterized protein LOC105839384 isoform X4 [Monomorium pharaonis]|uniref:uncharacterized protein LOC105839384 isoform X4 n=1 Tax=Monomorium pharaonis TaxID=307658 RepID=UPI001747812F|nr:uncharacterized protein LOC105839384 isoform X4 [Monomorium pharaonis]